MSALTRLVLKTRANLTPTVVTKAKTLTAAEATYGVIVSNVGATAAITYVLPSAKPGMRITAIAKAAFELRLDPFGTETISNATTGVAGVAGKYVAVDALGESLELICVVAGTWDVVGAADGTVVVEA